MEHLGNTQVSIWDANITGGGSFTCYAITVCSITSPLFISFLLRSFVPSYLPFFLFLSSLQNPNFVCSAYVVATLTWFLVRFQIQILKRATWSTGEGYWQLVIELKGDNTVGRCFPNSWMGVDQVPYRFRKIWRCPRVTLTFASISGPELWLVIFRKWLLGLHPDPNSAQVLLFLLNSTHSKLQLAHYCHSRKVPLGYTGLIWTHIQIEEFPTVVIRGLCVI